MPLSNQLTLAVDRPQGLIFERFASENLHVTTVKARWDIEGLAREVAGTLMSSNSSIEGDGSDGLIHHDFLWQHDERVFVYWEHDILSVWAPSATEATRVCKEILARHRISGREEAVFWILCHSNDGWEGSRVPIGRGHRLSPESLRLHYLDAVADGEPRLRRILGSRKQGLVLLSGPPGTGKTSFIRHLMAQCPRRRCRFYVIPACSYEQLSRPDLYAFWLRMAARSRVKRRVVVIEDADELLLNRGPDNRAAVSTLLNASDGLLGDVLGMVVICTFNAPIDELDPAIVRPGRLLMHLPFERMSHSKAERLADALDATLPMQDDYSLAEVFCAAGSQPSVPLVPPSLARRINGFAHVILPS